MLQSLERGEDGAAILRALAGQVSRFARDKVGCRVVQKALDCASPEQAHVLAMEMVGSVKQATRCPNGNFVIQKIVTTLPAEDIEFAAKELLGKAGDVAKHRYGCRVACRIVERRGEVEPASSIAEFISELLQRAFDLSQHAFAHHTMQSILEHGTAGDRQKIVAALRPCILANAQGRSSSYVVASALECCDEVDRHTLVMDLLEHLPTLTRSLSGCHVIKALLAVAGSHLPDAARRLQEVAAELASTRHGRRIIQDFGLASHW
jgi:mRNA-binding protein PUF3